MQVKGLECATFDTYQKALHHKWGYRIKGEHDDSTCYKARLVVKGAGDCGSKRSIFGAARCEDDIPS
jgi:hypothetical protein